MDSFVEFLTKETEAWRNAGTNPAKQPSAFFYFSGHGAALSEDKYESNFIIPTDSKAAMAQDLRDYAYPVRGFADKLEKIGANAVFVVIDACRTPLPDGAKDSPKSMVAELSRSGVIVANAASPSEKADQHSGYAEDLAQLMVVPGAREVVVFADAGARVASRSANHQLPEVKGALLRPFYFQPR
jgi:hypothetical protein